MIQRYLLHAVLHRLSPARTARSRCLPSGLPSAQSDGLAASFCRRHSTRPLSATEQTLIVVKPDGVQRRLAGRIIQRFEQRGFKLVSLKMMQVPDDLLLEHYREIKKKPFFNEVKTYMTAGPVIVMVWEGYNVVQTSRNMVGHTNPAEAQAGTIRGDFSHHISRNVVHASDSLEGAKREIRLWFQEGELMDWKTWDQQWTREC